MKIRLSGVVASLFTYSSFFSTITYATTEENITDGLSKEFWERAVKAAAAAALSSEQDFTYWDNSWQGRRDYFDHFSGEDTDLKYYTEEGFEAGRDDAILIEDDGQCFVAFQATQMELFDWLQNANMGWETLCNDSNECCTFRQGFVNGWNTQWKAQLISDIEACVARCNKDVCLIISGHSQGGGIATTASLQLADITPKYEVITYAAPPALTVEPESCSPQMNFHVHYRFGKALYKDPADDLTGGLSGIVFDKVSFLGPDPIGQTYSVGEFIILSSEDTQNVAHVGFNTELVLRPWDDYPWPLGRAHDMYWIDINDKHFTGYLSIVDNILKEDSFPVGVSGLQNNMHCGGNEILCASGRCDRANGELHTTCKSKLNNGEPCNADMDCLSGRCPSTFLSNCEDKLNNDEPCIADTDCISGRCSSISSNCEDMAQVGEPCNADTECISGRCSSISSSCEDLAQFGEPCDDDRDCSDDNSCEYWPIANDWKCGLEPCFEEGYVCFSCSNCCSGIENISCPWYMLGFCTCGAETSTLEMVENDEQTNPMESYATVQRLSRVMKCIPYLLLVTFPYFLD